MKFSLLIILLIFLFFCCSNNDEETDEWTVLKNSTLPFVQLEEEFGAPFRQPLSSMGWEDGIHISRDGLDLYCTYMPVDALSWSLDSSTEKVWEFSDYLRGPLYDMDLVTNPLSKDAWLHSDILYAHRSSTDESFTGWVNASGASENFYSEGAPFVFNQDGDNMDGFLVTSNKREGSDIDVYAILDTVRNPSGDKVNLSMAFSPTTYTYTEDNPDAARLDDDTIVLFFDSSDYPGGEGEHDIWYVTANAEADTWGTVTNVSSINTALTEHQPHLYKNPDDGYWYLYYSAYHTDGKLAIFRAKKNSAGDPADKNWNDWGTPEVVISSGNADGIGEPTLTENGDISFVVVYDKGDADPYDRYDADPWFLPKK